MQTEVYYHFVLLLTVSGPSIFQEVVKSHLGSQRLVKLFQSIFGQFKRKSDVKFYRFCLQPLFWSYDSFSSLSS